MVSLEGFPNTSVRNRAAAGQEAPNTNAEGKVLKNRPKASRLRQQQLAAWQPILTATTVIPTVFCVGIVFIPIGIALYLASHGVEEVRVDYTDTCPQMSQMDCRIDFTVPNDMEGPVYFYYYLENFFQNHRRYVKSRNDQQYLGKLENVAECEPFNKDSNGRVIVPCGAIANSMFNDTFRILAPDQITNVPLTTDGVLWDVDKNRKFKNPDGWTNGAGCTGAFANTSKPPNWPKPICEMEGGLQNVDFIVWMRTAALPNFRKLYRILDQTDSTYSKGLPAGNYKLVVMNNFPVHQFNGRKHFVISTTSWAGGKNPFLGIAFLVVGSLAILLAIIFVIIHIKFGHSVDELSNINRQ